MLKVTSERNYSKILFNHWILCNMSISISEPVYYIYPFLKMVKNGSNFKSSFTHILILYRMKHEYWFSNNRSRILALAWYGLIDIIEIKYAKNRSQYAANSHYSLKTAHISKQIKLSADWKAYNLLVYRKTGSTFQRS